MEEDAVIHGDDNQMPVSGTLHVAKPVAAVAR